MRAQVARALSRLGDPRAVVPLVGKVQDSVPDVRQAVVRALGDLGDSRATQALLLALRDNVAEVKVEALAALGRLRAPEAASAIAPLALERNPAVRQAALVALGRIATPDAVRALMKALGTQEDGAGTLERTSVRDALVSAGAPAVTELTALLERPVSSAVATSAAWVLGELRATKSAPAIVAALRKGTLPPGAALRALAGAGSAEQVPVVLEFVADPSPVVRDEALRAATALLDPARPDGRAVEPLAATLRAPRTSPGERAAVATLLGRTGAPRAATELAGLVSSKDAPLRLAAIDALGALGGASSESKPAAGGADAGHAIVDDALVPLLADTDSAVRLHTAVALAASGGVKARTALLGKLDGGDEVDRYAVLAALGGILARHPDEAAAARLFKQLAVAAGPERDAVIEAAGRARLPSVLRALGEAAAKGDVDDRRAIAAVLAGHRGAPAAIALAKSLAGDTDGSVRAQAAFTLGTVGDQAVLPQLATLAKSGDADVAADAAGGDRTPRGPHRPRGPGRRRRRRMHDARRRPRCGPRQRARRARLHAGAVRRRAHRAKAPRRRPERPRPGCGRSGDRERAGPRGPHRARPLRLDRPQRGGRTAVSPASRGRGRERCATASGRHRLRRRRERHGGQAARSVPPRVRGRHPPRRHRRSTRRDVRGDGARG